VTHTRWIHRIRAIFALLAIVLVSVTGVVPAQAASYDPITGTGSTWSQNAIEQWRKNVGNNYGMTVNYTGVGSSAGRRDFIAGNVDFAVSEIPFQLAPEDGSAPEQPTRGYAYMPIVAGGTSFMYNLKINGVRVSNLRLSGEVITKIFTGVITKWNDPAIQADNPGLAMPDKGITPVVRSDGSGSTAQFSLWMSTQHADLWNAFCASVGRTTPCGPISQYPTFGNAKAQSGSYGVAGYVSQDYGEGAITYVENSYTVESGFTVAKVLNQAGYYVAPTPDAVAVALTTAQITPAGGPDALTQVLDGVYNSADKRAYPLSSYGYLIVPTEVGGVFTAKKGATLGAFANYYLCEGQQDAARLGYAPLPMNLVLAGFDQIKRIPGASTAHDIDTCNNPTFAAGESPADTTLLRTAPEPPESDRLATIPCTEPLSGVASGAVSLCPTTVAVQDTALSLELPSNAVAAFTAPTRVNGLSLTTGTLPPIVINDGRLLTHPGWDVTADVTPFQNAADNTVTIGAGQLGLRPSIVSTSGSAVTVAGAQLAGHAQYPAAFASAASTGLAGNTVFGGEITFLSPADKPAGVYLSTLTLTLVSR